MGDLFLKILEMSYGASFVILIILFIRLILKKAPKIYSYMLWSVVLLRLVCPFSIESGLSIIPSNVAFSQNVVIEPKQDKQYDAYTEVQSKVKSEVKIQQETQISDTYTVEDNSVNKTIDSYKNNINNYSGSKSEQVLFFASWTWFVGLVLLLFYGFTTLATFKSRLLNVELYKENIYFVDNISTAFVLGVFSPKIYIPRNLSANELEYIVLHEKIHIKRYDYFIKLVSYIAVCIHWFNPLVWLAYFKSVEDMEMSCDESVIKAVGSDIKKDYSNSLLTFTTKEYAVTMPLAFGEVSVKARIKNVLNYKSVSGKVGIGLIILVLVFSAILFLNPIKPTTLLEVREETFEQVIPTDTTEYILQSSLTYFNGYNINDVIIPKDNYTEVATIINRVELKESSTVYEHTNNEMQLSIIGKHDSSDEQLFEYYTFNEDFTLMYISDMENKSKAYEVINSSEVKKFFDDIYSYTTVSLGTYTYNFEDPSSVDLDFEGLYNSKTSLSNTDDGIKVLNMTPLGRTTQGESVEFTKTGDLKGLTWNLKKTEDFDYVQQLTQSVLLAFILIDDLDYFEVYVDDILDVRTYKYDRARIDEIYGKDIREYGKTPEELEQFITKGYQIENLTLTTQSSGGTKIQTELPMDFTVEKAVEEGYYVDVHGELYNEDVMTEFVNDVNDEDVTKALVRTIRYTTEGDPIITFFRYEDDKITVARDSSRDKFSSGENTITTYNANIVMYHDPETLGGEEYYYVTNLKEITKEDFNNGFDGELLYYKIDE